MKTATVIKALKSHKGTVFVDVQFKDESLYIKAVKSDVIHVVENLPDGQAEFFYGDNTCRDLYIHKAYTV